MSIRMMLLLGACLALSACAHATTTTYALVGWDGEKEHPDKKFVLSVDGPRPTPAEFRKAVGIVGFCVSRPPAPPLSEDEKIGWCLVGGQIGANRRHQLLNASIVPVSP